MCVWYCRSCLSAAQWSCVNESGLCWGGACRWYAVRLGCCWFGVLRLWLGRRGVIAAWCFVGAARSVVCRRGSCWFLGYAGESLLLPPSRSLRVWGRWVGTGGAVRRRRISSEVVCSRTRPVCSRLRRFPRKAACPPALATSRCASVTMKNQCVAVRCPSPLEPNREDGGCVAGPFGPLSDLSWSPPLRIGAIGAWAYDELPAAMGKLCDRPHTGIR